MKTILKNKYIQYGLLISIGLGLGWLIFHKPEIHQHTKDAAVETAEIWTCSMHPQIRQEKPGQCPLCGMDLIPLTQNTGTSTDSTAIHFSKDAAELANVETSVVVHDSPVKELRLLGKVQMDERLMQSQVAQISGRIEKLLVSFTGEPIKKGQLLAILYSPELITAQQELIEAAKTKSTQPEIYASAKERLLQWKITSAQINQIEKSGRPKTNFEVYATSSGIVTAKKVNSGDYVNQGTVLFEVANLSHVWIQFEAYESDLPFLKVDDPIAITFQALPGKNFSARIRFIDPYIDPTNRIAKVRVEMNNSDGSLKPEMFANGLIKTKLKAYQDKLVIPSSAVLWTGKRSVVYVKTSSENGYDFVLREVELGPKVGDNYVILSGLEEAEEVVTNGAFSVDAAAQLAGKPSMMNQ